MSTLKCSNLQNASAANPAFVLAADGSATANLSSLNGGPIAGSRNRIINGDMRIDQRNAGAAVTVTTSGNAFATDRFAIARANGYVNTATAQQVTDAPSGFARSLRYTAGTAETPTGGLYSLIAQSIEGFNISDLGWGAVGASAATLSFWVKISIAGTFGVTLRSADATLSFATSFSYPSANTWQFVTISVPGPTTGGTAAFSTTNGIGVTIYWELGTGSAFSVSASSSWQSANALGVTGTTKLNSTTGATYQITGVQLEPGTVATPFERRSYGAELALCQRYCESSFTDGIPPGTDSLAVVNSGAWLMYGDGGSVIQFAVRKRAFPTLTVNAPLASPSINRARQASNGTLVTVNSSAITQTAFSLLLNSGAGATLYQFGWTASAEL